MAGIIFVNTVTKSKTLVVPPTGATLAGDSARGYFWQGPGYTIPIGANMVPESAYKPPATVAAPVQTVAPAMVSKTVYDERGNAKSVQVVSGSTFVQTSTGYSWRSPDGKSGGSLPEGWSPTKPATTLPAGPSTPSTAKITIVGGGGQLYLPPESIAGVVPPGSQVLVTVDQIKVTTPTGQVTTYASPTEANTQQISQKVTEVNQQVVEFNKRAAEYEAHPTEAVYQSLITEKANLDSKANEVNAQAVIHNAMIDMNTNMVATSPTVKAPAASKKNWKDALSMVWQGVTPWDEATGETFYQNKYFPNHTGKITGWDVLKGAGLFTTFNVIPGIRTTVANVEGNPSGLENAYMVLADVAMLVGIVQGTLGQKINPAEVNVMQKKIISAAREVGDAQTKLNRAMDSFDYRTQASFMEDTGATAELQAAQQAARVADKNFMEYFQSIKDITPEQLAKLEAKARLPGLKGKMIEISEKYNALGEAWKELDNFEIGTEGYVKKLTEIQGIKDSMDKAVTELSDTMEPIYSAREPTGKVGKLMEGEKGQLEVINEKFRAFDPETGREVVIMKTRTVNRPGTQTMTVERPKLEPWVTRENFQKWIDRDYHQTPKQAAKTSPVSPSWRSDTGMIPGDVIRENFWLKQKTPSPVSDAGMAIQERTAWAFRPVRVTRAATVSMSTGLAQVLASGVFQMLKSRGIPLNVAQTNSLVSTVQRLSDAIATKISTGILTKTEDVSQSSFYTFVDPATVSTTDTTIEDATAIINETLTEILNDTDTDLATKTETETELAQQVDKAIQTAIEVATETETPTRPRPEVVDGGGNKLIFPPLFSKSLGRQLTKVEATASMAWKQGWDYKLWHPPFGPTDVIDSRTPVEGVPMYEGARSAYDSLIARGDLPPHSALPMGAFEAHVETFQSTLNGNDDEAELHFVRRGGSRRPKARPKPRVTSPGMESW